MKNVLTRNFVTVPDSLGLLPLPQAPAEEPQSPSVPGSLLPTPHSPPIHLLIYLSIHPPIHPSILPSSLCSHQPSGRIRESSLILQETLSREPGALFQG